MSLSTTYRDFTRTVRRHRAVLAALLAAAAVATALPVLTPDAAATTHVVAAARDLTAGAPLKAEDLTLTALPATSLPDGVVTDMESLLGRVLMGPVRRGEPLTDVRLLGSGLLQDRTLVAAPVRLADAATVTLLRAGDRVDVLAAPTDSSRQVAAAVVVAAGVQVLAVPSGQEDEVEGLVIVAATPHTAARLAAAAVGSRLSVTVLAP